MVQRIGNVRGLPVVPCWERTKIEIRPMPKAGNHSSGTTTLTALDSHALLCPGRVPVRPINERLKLHLIKNDSGTWLKGCGFSQIYREQMPESVT